MNAMDRILALTDEIEQQIDRGDWLSASETDVERRRLLVALLEANDIGRLSEHEQRCLKDILQRTNRAAAEVGQFKSDIAASSRRLRTATHALHRYQQNSPAETAALLRD